MIISPKKIIWEGILQIENEDQIQQNGIDLTLWSISRILPGRNFLTKAIRSHTERGELIFDSNDMIVLTPGKYDVLFAEKINLPNWICSFVVPRSTLNRGWNFTTSGWYDAGFSGPMGWVLHITEWELVLEKWVRLAQMVFMTAEEGELYNGIYNNNTIATKQ